MHPFFSVIIPLYNKEKSVASTLDSVLQQSFRDYEIIVVNDGSTDHSRQVVEHYIESHQSHPIRLINKENGGAASARNLGIKESHGQYIALLDADDLWLEHYLMIQYNLIKDFPNKSLYYTGYSAIGHNGVIERTGEYAKHFRGELSNPWAFPMKPCTNTAVFTPKDAMEVGLFDEKLIRSQDVDMWYRLILYGGAAADSIEGAVYRLAAENRLSKVIVPIDNYVVSKIPYYKKYRDCNPEFRKYFDDYMAGHLSGYLRRPQYRLQARHLMGYLDMSVISKSKRMRLRFPYFFYFYDKIKRLLK